jgi:hypothetical protein
MSGVHVFPLGLARQDLAIFCIIQYRLTSSLWSIKNETQADPVRNIKAHSNSIIATIGSTLVVMAETHLHGSGESVLPVP